MSRCAFRDEHEDMAYAVICEVKYGGYGGQVDARLIRRCGDILRGRPLEPPKPTLPALPILPPPPIVLP